MRILRLFAMSVPGLLTLVCFLAHAGAEPRPARESVLPVSADTVDLRQKIGQMILIGFVGSSPTHSGFQRVLSQVEAGEIGGVLYLGRNLKNREMVQQMNTALKAAATELPLPLIAIDQEGGVVQRLKRRHGFPQTVSAKRMAQGSSPSEAKDAYGVLAKGLTDWGFTLNLGPVVDVDIYSRNPIIGRLGRSYSRNPERVAAYGTAFVEAHRAHGVLTALKHFPGHGSSRRDSHKGTADISRTWSKRELLPFQTLIENDKVDLIMTAHVINRSLQEKGKRLPVSLSERALTDTLRGDLGFTGVIITDDLQMDAIRRNFTLEETVLRAVRAGTDVLLFANDKRPDPEVPAKVAKILLQAVENDPSMEGLIDAAYDRILMLKRTRNGHSFAAAANPDRLKTWLTSQATDPERCALSDSQ